MKLRTHNIKCLIAGQKMSIAKLAEKIGMSRQQLSVILAKGTCTTASVGKIAEGLGVEIGEIVKEE